nr:hypothetical protein Iba_chr12aCG17970 [Ipomoea batatas]GMD66980.1 hypothetical protein Iba_chr12cCG20230 [Ipomoea batatas]GMD69142.1 hypothetical protein Iba_chr12dCG16090 [Ipomoea batatas]
MVAFKSEVTDNRDFVLALWNLKRQMLCKKQLRLLQFQLVDAKLSLRRSGLLIHELEAIIEGSYLGGVLDSEMKE